MLNDTDEIKGRIYLFVIDDYRLLQQNTFQLKRLVQDFIRKRMGPDDIAAIIFASVTHGQDFTQDRRALLSALDRTMGSFDGQDTSGTQALRTISTVQKLGSMIEQLGRIRSRHKALLYISPTLGCSVTRVPQMGGLSGGDPRTSRTAIGPSVTERPGMRCFDMLQDIVRAAVRANVSVYSLDPTGVQNPSWVSPTIDGRGGPAAAVETMQMANGTMSTGLFDGLRVLADETGGFAAININGFNKAFDRIVRENSSYYLIGYYSTNARNDGSERKNVITLSRPGVDLVYRPSYTATRN